MSFSIKFLIFTTTINLLIQLTLTDDLDSCVTYGKECNSNKDCCSGTSCQHTKKDDFLCYYGNCLKGAYECDPKADVDKCCYGGYCKYIEYYGKNLCALCRESSQSCVTTKDCCGNHLYCKNLVCTFI